MIETYIQQIQNLVIDKHYYSVFNLHNSDSFFLGKDLDGNLIFLIRPDQGALTNFNYPPSHRGKSLDIQYNIICEFPVNGGNMKDEFTLLTLKSDSKLMYNLFIALCVDLVELIGDDPPHDKVVSVVEGLRKLFTSVYQKGSHTEIGLWGELFVISQASDMEKAIDSWHLNPMDTFDFNDGKHKMEVKTTIQNQRVHTISLNQILKSIESGSLICSIMTCQIDLGKDLIDLKNIIDTKVNMEYRNKLSEKILKAVGDGWESYDHRYDYTTAVNSMKYFEAAEIPKIDPSRIDPNISNVKFSVNLESTDDMNIEGMKVDCKYLPQ
jgi:hypothetical protein